MDNLSSLLLVGGNAMITLESLILSFFFPLIFHFLPTISIAMVIQSNILEQGAKNSDLKGI